ncbi:MAG: DNA methyltransferase, partial [Candidatus Heimdallarchaeaceae archaeon]
ILTTSNEGDLILDPMAGTGTTGHVAKELQRDFVMIEREKKYIEGIKERFKTAPNLEKRKKSSMEEEVERTS